MNEVGEGEWEVRFPLLLRRERVREELKRNETRIVTKKDTHKSI
jgi:hypothetical protein